VWLAVPTLDAALILSLVAAGAGVALVPDLAVERVPTGVTLHTLAVSVSRFDVVHTREATYADRSIRRLRDLLQDSARRLSLVTAPAGE